MTTTEIYAHYAVQINLHRVKKGSSIRDLASRTGVSPTTITGIEQGKGCSIDTLYKLCKELNFTLNIEIN